MIKYEDTLGGLCQGSEEMLLGVLVLPIKWTKLYGRSDAHRGGDLGNYDLHEEARINGGISSTV